jgi:restriction system protein
LGRTFRYFSTWNLGIIFKGEKTILTDEQAREIFLKWVDIHRKAKLDKSEKEIIEEQEESEPDDIQPVNKNGFIAGITKFDTGRI